MVLFVEFVVFFDDVLWFVDCCDCGCLDWCEGVVVEIGFYLGQCFDQCFVVDCEVYLLVCYVVGF